MDIKPSRGLAKRRSWSEAFKRQVIAETLVFSSPRGTRSGASALRFSGMKPVRETLLGMVKLVDDARQRRWLNRNEGSGTAACLNSGMNPGHAF